MHPKIHFAPFPPLSFPLAAASRTVGRVPQISPYTMPSEITPYHLVKTYNASNFFNGFFYYTENDPKGGAKPWLDRPISRHSPPIGAALVDHGTVDILNLSYVNDAGTSS